MKKRHVFFLGLLVVLLTMGLVLAGCGGGDDSSGSGGNNSGGNDNSGSNNSGGNNSGGNNSGGNDNSGGNSSGGNNSGGNSSGGNNSGGNSSGGNNSGGNNSGGTNSGGNNSGGNNSGSGSGGDTVQYRIDQPLFGTCSKSGNNLVINWTLKTSGKSPNGVYTYTQPKNIIIGVWDGSTSAWLEPSSNTLSGSARSYTLNNYATYATSNNQVGIRVRCTSDYNETSARTTYFISSDTFSPSYN